MLVSPFAIVRGRGEGVRIASGQVPAHIPPQVARGPEGIRRRILQSCVSDQNVSITQGKRYPSKSGDRVISAGKNAVNLGRNNLLFLVSWKLSIYFRPLFASTPFGREIDACFPCISTNFSFSLYLAASFPVKLYSGRWSRAL